MDIHSNTIKQFAFDLFIFAPKEICGSEFLFARLFVGREYVQYVLSWVFMLEPPHMMGPHGSALPSLLTAQISAFTQNELSS